MWLITTLSPEARVSMSEAEVAWKLMARWRTEADPEQPEIKPIRVKYNSCQPI